MLLLLTLLGSLAAPHISQWEPLLSQSAADTGWSGLLVYPGLLEAWLLVAVLREREKSLPLFSRVTPVLPRVWSSVLSECLAVGPFVHSVKLFFPRAGAQVPGARGLGPPEWHILLHVGSRPHPPPIHTL